MYRRTCFNKKGCRDTNIVPDEKTKYECKPLLQTKSNYYVSEDKMNIAYCTQILVEECGYKGFTEYNIAHKDFVFTDSEPELEEEFNDDDENDE